MINRIHFLIALALALNSSLVKAGDIPFIDAHSQLPSPAVVNNVIPLMDKAGIRHVILSFRQNGRWSHVLDLAAAHPGRISPAVKIKGRHWPTGTKKFFKSVKKQLRSGAAAAMGEALLYHAAKGNKAPEWTVGTDSKQFRFVLEICREKGWPLIIHIEFRAVENLDDWMATLETLLDANRDVTFPLIHMAQLDASQVKRLIATHPNVYFMVSHSTPITTSTSRQPWTNLFDGKTLKPEWHALMAAHPDRFVLNFDNVWEKDWSEDNYLAQARLWRKALATLPNEIAHAIAHRNAERLWRLSPVR